MRGTTIASIAQYVFSLAPLIFMSAWYTSLEALDAIFIAILVLSLLASYNIYGYAKTTYRNAPAFWVFPASLLLGITAGSLSAGVYSSLLFNITTIIGLAFFSATVNKSVFSFSLQGQSTAMVLVLYASTLYALGLSIILAVFVNASVVYTTLLVLSPLIEHSLALLAKAKHSLLMYFSLLFLIPPYLYMLYSFTPLLAFYLAGINTARAFLGRKMSGLILSLDYFARTTLLSLLLLGVLL